MENMLHIGNKVDEGFADHYAETVERVFKAGFEYRMDQKTIRDALKYLPDALSVHNVSIENCCFTNEGKDEDK